VPGQTFDYTIAVGNVGECTLTNVAVTDVVTGPAGSTVVLTEPTATSVGAPTSAGSGLENTEVKWADVGPIAPDARVTLRIRVKVPANATVGQRYSDRVTVTGVCDGRPVDQTVTLNEPPVVAPGTGPCNLTGSNKTASHIEVFPGEQFNFLINLFNDSGQPCTDITITDTLSEKVTFVSCSDNCTVDGRTITWHIANLGPGSSMTLRVTVAVNAGATGTIPNSAVIDTPTTNPVTVNTPGPTITQSSVLNANQPAGRSGVADLARTGPGSPLLAWPVALGLGLAAYGFQRFRRRALTT